MIESFSSVYKSTNYVKSGWHPAAKETSNCNTSLSSDAGCHGKKPFLSIMRK